MGTYNMVGENRSQIKVGELSLQHFPIGSETDLDDGLYLSYEGWFVIKNKIVFCEGKIIYDKYGQVINNQIVEVLNENNPIVEMVKQIEKKYKAN